MTETYRHTQIGYVILVSLGAALALLLYLMSTLGGNPVAVAVTILLLICLPLFGALTVIVRGNMLEVRLGIGLLRKRFSLQDIASVQTVRNHWYFGWGIRWLGSGWLYNVSGLDAIELQMRNGRRHRIGTDAPGELERALRAAIDTIANSRD